MLEKQYFIIYIKDNDFAEIVKIDNHKYNCYKDAFDYVYHTKNGDTYTLHKNTKDGIDMLITDDNSLYKLLDDLKEQGFCNSFEFNVIDDYFNGNYKQYGKAF